MMALTFPDYLPQAQRLATRLEVELKEISIHHFPDQESLVRLPAKISEHILLIRSLNHPNEKLVELLFAAKTARRLGAKRITLIAPYLCYMRQDIENHPGEAISQQIIGEWFADLFDDLITVDPHLHRISSLDEAFSMKNAIALSAGPVITSLLLKKFDHAILIGPDSESKQWVASLAEKIGFDYGIATKIRQGDKQVKISLPKTDFQNQTIVIVDDIASTGRTIVETTKLLRSQGANEIYVVVTHPLFCNDAEQLLRKSGIKTIWSTDSISHSTAVMHLDELLANAVKKICN
jgi:ribose-phosphate pyrophosphokinase